MNLADRTSYVDRLWGLLHSSAGREKALDQISRSSYPGLRPLFRDLYREGKWDILSAALQRTNSILYPLDVAALAEADGNTDLATEIFRKYYDGQEAFKESILELAASFGPLSALRFVLRRLDPSPYLLKRLSEAILYEGADNQINAGRLRALLQEMESEQRQQFWFHEQELVKKEKRYLLATLASTGLQLKNPQSWKLASTGGALWTLLRGTDSWRHLRQRVGPPASIAAAVTMGSLEKALGVRLAGYVWRAL